MRLSHSNLIKAALACQFLKNRHGKSLDRRCGEGGHVCDKPPVRRPVLSHGFTVREPFPLRSGPPASSCRRLAGFFRLVQHANHCFVSQMLRLFLNHSQGELLNRRSLEERDDAQINAKSLAHAMNHLGGLQ